MYVFFIFNKNCTSNLSRVMDISLPSDVIKLLLQCCFLPLW